MGDRVMERFSQTIQRGAYSFSDLISRIVSESMDLVNSIMSNEPIRMHQRIVCSGCRALLVYPAGATTVQCGACNTITPVYPQGAGMDQIVCRGCRIPLMYYRGATSVQCTCCQTVNPIYTGNNLALVNCGNCHTALMFPRGAPSVRCSRCNFITSITSGPGSAPISAPSVTENAQAPPTTTQASTQSNSMTVVVENPMTVDEEGKLVSNVAVGIASGKK